MFVLSRSHLWDSLPWEALRELGEPLRTLGAAFKLLGGVLAGLLPSQDDRYPAEGVARLLPSILPRWTVPCQCVGCCIAATQVGARVLVEPQLPAPSGLYPEMLLLTVQN